jgi:metallo-beta-lactamase superfamily protein
MPTRRVHFLDVGEQEYGDAVLCELDGKRVLIDGAHPGDQTGSTGHPSIPQQLRTLLQAQEPVQIDLLIVTHAHRDHIGCLPFLVEHGALDVKWALVADPGLGWGRPATDEAPARLTDTAVRTLVAGLREEILSDGADDRAIAQLLADAASLEQRYITMLATLEGRGTNVVRYVGQDVPRLLEEFRGIGLRILGPSQEQLEACAAEIARLTDGVARRATDLLQQDPAASEAELYRVLVGGGRDTLDARDRPGPPINLQSIVTSFTCDAGVKLLFAGDMQFVDPQVGSPVVHAELAVLRRRVRGDAPFSLVKLSHHGSGNAFDSAMLSDLGSTAWYGICAGEDSLSHPNPAAPARHGARPHRLGPYRSQRPRLDHARRGDDGRPHTWQHR